MTAAERGNVTGLFLRGTRFIEFTLTNRVVNGMTDGSADNLSFVLTPKPLPPYFITAHGKIENGWRVEFTSRTNRLYVLERSENLPAWTELTLPTPGTGQTVVLVDTNPPTGQAFYRVGSSPP